MQKRTLYCSIIVIIVVAILATLGFIYYMNKNRLKTISIKDVKSVKLFPFQGANHTKEYSYDSENPNDMKVINNVINSLN